MEIKRATIGIGVGALMVAGAFLAGGVLQGTSSAQSVAPGKAAVVQQIQAQTQTQAQPQATPSGQATEVAEPNAEPKEAVGANGAEAPDGAEGADNSASEAAEAQALAAQATVTKQQAEQKALAANPGATVVKSELDSENGAVVYSVKLSNGTDVHVDAKSGSILATQADGNEKDGPEGAEAPEGANGMTTP